MFYSCNKLNCEIPEKLFYNSPQITGFNFTFSNCGFIGRIPEKLFSKCPSVTSFNSVFRQNGYIEGPIPENLFKNNAEAVDFSYAFQYSPKIYGVLSENIFNNNLKATKFQECFKSCNLTGKAPKLWERENVTSYSQCFYGCTKLSNYTEIPVEWK